ncbi:MAG: ABC transporter permease [Opitutus sp.]
MSWRNIVTVYLKELKDSLRDRRTLLSMIIIPTLVMPALIFGVGTIATKVVSKARDEIPRVMIVGGEDSPGVVAQLKAARKLTVAATTPDWRNDIAEKKIRAVVSLPRGFETGLLAGKADPVTLYFYEGELKSGFATGELDRFFRELRERTVTERLAERSLPATLVRPFEITRANVAPPEKVGGNLFGGIVPYFIVILCFTGAMYPAMDLTAGEKERGTMETLLCSPVARTDLVLGKFLMVLTGSVGAMIMSLASLGITAALSGMIITSGGGSSGGLAKIGGASMPMIDPTGLLGVVAMVFPVAVFFSGVMFAVSLFAKSFKEAQSYVGPMMIVVIMPAVVGMLPGIDLNARLALVPILNLSLVCKEMLSGVWHWNYIAIIFGSSCLYAAIALWLAVKMFQREDVIFRA